MQGKIEEILGRAKEAISSAADTKALEAVRVSLLGKKGELSGLLRSMGNLSAEERPKIGQVINEAKTQVEAMLEESRSRVQSAEQALRLKAEAIDVTQPVQELRRGAMHPMSIVLAQIVDIFVGMGFDVEEGPEIETDRNNFELMNVPKNHPARDAQDTLYITEDIVLRTHTSPVQARTMAKRKPPFRIICPGRVYRADEMDATHSPVFHQIEGLVIGEGIQMSDLKGTLRVFNQTLFGNSIQTRLRPSFFPFTEPSAEVDVTCVTCGGKGCRVCKGSGWIEIMGAGMVHPRVLSMNGIHGEQYSGFAFGMGLDRITNILYSNADMRVLWENDARFVSQFRNGGLS